MLHQRCVRESEAVITVAEKVAHGIMYDCLFVICHQGASHLSADHLSEAVCMQSWRSIREALGNRPGSGNHLVSDEGEEPQVASPPAVFLTFRQCGSMMAMRDHSCSVCLIDTCPWAIG